MTRVVSLCAVLALSACNLVYRQPPTIEEIKNTPDVLPLYVEPIDRDEIAPLASNSPYWDKVRRGEPFKIGINPEYPPFAVRTSDGYAGFSIGLSEHLGATLGVPIEFVEVSAVQAPPALINGEVDLVISGLTQTAWRAAKITFSRPYLTATQAALISRTYLEGAKGTDEELRRGTIQSYFDLARIKGLRIGVARHTRPHRLARRFFQSAEITPFDTIREASQALIAGQLDAIVHDDPYIRVWGALNPSQAGAFGPLLSQGTEEPYGIAMRKGDIEFMLWLDAYVDGLHQDGTVSALYRRHFTDLIWLDDAQIDEGGSQ